jgi:hypothetical protein
MKISPRNNSATLFKKYGGRGDCDPTVTGTIAGTAETGESKLHEASGLGRWRARCKVPTFVTFTLKESFRHRMSAVAESKSTEKGLRTHRNGRSKLEAQESNISSGETR